MTNKLHVRETTSSRENKKFLKNELKLFRYYIHITRDKLFNQFNMHGYILNSIFILLNKLWFLGTN